MPDFDDFQVGTRIESANNNQPGEVIATWTDSWLGKSADWFEVKWDRHPNGKTRIYHRDPWYNVGHDSFGGFPTIIGSEPTNEELDDLDELRNQVNADPVAKAAYEKAIAGQRLVFVDPIADAKNALQVAFNQAAKIEGDNVVIDVNVLFLALAENGWSYNRG